MPDQLSDEQLAEWEKLARRNVVMGINRYADDAILVLVRALRDARDEARRDIEEYHTLIARQSDLLTRTVKALRGEPPKLVWWSHHDVPERAAKVVAERDALRERLVAVETAIRAEIESWHHEVVEDCWYTCPAATEEREGDTCCDDAAGTDCNCGLEWRRKRILAALAADPSRSPSIPVGQEPDSRRCMTLGPEDIPASTVGVLYDGDDEHTDVAYCAECAAAMVDAGVFGSGFGGQHG